MKPDNPHEFPCDACGMKHSFRSYCQHCWTNNYIYHYQKAFEEGFRTAKNQPLPPQKKKA